MAPGLRGQVLGVLCTTLLLQLGSASLVKRVDVPHTAQPGFIITSLTTWGNPTLDKNDHHLVHKHFTILNNGDLATKSHVSNLVGQKIPIQVFYEVDADMWLDTIHVHIRHAKDILVFHQPKYTSHIKENEPSFTQVEDLNSFYVEQGGKKVDAAYDIIEGPTDLFEFHRDDDGGVILVAKKPLDRETNGEYLLRVMASVADHKIQPVTTQIRIIVDDENDNIPKFETTQYFATIKESTPAHTTILKLRAVDPDCGKISYRLVPCEFFEVESFSGNVKVKESKKLKPGKYKMHAYARDSCKKEGSPVNVIVKVTKKSSTLKFQPNAAHSRQKRAIRPERRIKVSENSIGNLLSVLDSTSTDNNFHFAFKQPAPHALEVNPYNGSIRVKDEEKLDYEKEPEIDFTIVITRQDDTSVQDEQPIKIIVSDENDEKPRFRNEPIPFLATVSSTAPPGTSVYHLLATDDDDGSEIRYSLESGGDDRFEVDPQSGVVRVKGTEPFLSGTEYEIGVAAYDINAKPEQRSETHSLKILVGERDPQFFKPHYVAEFSENSLPGHKIVDVKAYAHQGFRVRYDLITESGGDSAEFDIDTTTGWVELRKQLDYEKDPTKYHLKVRATELSDLPRTSTVNLVINLKDENDNAPVFPLSQYIKQNIAETVTPGTVIINVTAKDLDSATNAHLVYSVSDSNFVVESINNVGYIKTKGRLDYDHKPDHTYNFTITATDHGNPPRSGTAQVRITVYNMNDESPVFAQPIEYVEVSEDAPSNTMVHVVQAYDPDGDGVSYSFAGGQLIKGPFSIDSSSGIITLVGDLDKSKVSYKLNVTATDDGRCCPDKFRARTSSGMVVVQVKDINNNAPRFPECGSYKAQVQEEANLGTSVIQVSASDGDTGPNGEVRYSLVKSVNQGTQKFIINSKTGLISTAEVFDREKIMEYGITVKAEDRGNPSLAGFCSFRVRISDVNDNKPVFDFASYEVSVEESRSPGRRVIQVYAKDKDERENSHIMYYMKEDPSGFFQINRMTGWISVKSPMVGRDSVKLVVEARDSGKEPQSSTVSVNIQITQQVNEYPKWEEDYSKKAFTVNESASVNTIVCRLRAISSVPDTTVNYVIQSGNTPEQNAEDSKSFFSQIDERTNEMLILVYRPLDYEHIPVYTLTVKAANRAANSLHNDTRITVKVIDNNDEIPQFIGLDENGRYLGSVAENLAPGAEVITVSATDRDARDIYKKVKYKIKPTGLHYDKFEINEVTGRITTRDTFDRETLQEYYIVVVAEDQAPSDRPYHMPPGSGNRGEAEVQISITDKNDNPPFFERQMYTAPIPENAYPGTLVLSVTAQDKDEENGLSYSILDGNVGNVFEVKPDTGEIRVRGTLDYEAGPKTYRLRYRVFDDKFESVTNVIINVTDVNDNPPMFAETVYKVTNVQEEDHSISPENPKFLIKVTATDKDTDRRAISNIRYALSGQFARDRTFTIEPRTGKIYLNRPLDRDEPNGRADWTFNVLAYDEPGAQGLVGYAEVQVSPQDINDNSPVFDQTRLEGEVPENCAAGTALSHPVRAIDRDRGNNGTIEYELRKTPLDKNGNYMFDINRKYGVIRTLIANSLDREEKDEHELIVVASDRGFPPRSAVATFIVKVKDKNDNKPVFTRRIYKTTMSEDFPTGASITSVSATDADIGTNALLTYTLKQEDRKHFSVRSVKATNTGVLKVHRPVDFESMVRPFFNLTVYVEDADPLHRSEAYIEVEVTDANDNPPEFGRLEKAVVFENVSIGHHITKVQARDRDRGVNGEFYYAIDRKTDPKKQFSIDNEGHVKVRNKLDRETVEVHKLHILAVDKGEPPMTGTGTLTVTVLDVNDNFPTFAKTYYAKVNENVDPPIQIIEFSAKDADGPKNGPLYTFWQPCFGACPCDDNPYCQDFNMKFLPKGGDNGHGSGVISSKSRFDREQRKEYHIPIIMEDSGNPKMSGTNYLVVTIGDENDNPHNPGHKEIFVYNYRDSRPPWRGEFTNAKLGNVYAEDPDDWDRPDKTFTFVDDTPKEHFILDKETGELSMNGFVPAGVYAFSVNVYDKKFDKTVESTVAVTVQEIGDDAVFNSGSVRLTDMTAEEFIEQPKQSNDPNAVPKKSLYDKFREKVATLLSTKTEYVDIFTVRNHPTLPRTVDIRYSAHGSPYYKPIRLDGMMDMNREQFADLGLKIAMVPIDECIKEKCESGGCSNKLTTSMEPLLVNTNSTSLVGVTAYVVSKCECAAKVFDDESKKCKPNSCLNAGRCIQEEGYFRCQCPSGFDGPHCEQTHISFDGDGWAWFKPLEQCEDSHTSLEFMTTQPDGMILYNGPVKDLAADDPTDFMLLELRNGFPVLRLDHGSGEVILTLNGINQQGIQSLKPLNDGSWHRIDIYRTAKNVRLVVDRCAIANVNEDSQQSEEDRSACEISGSTPDENMYLNVHSPLQLGGRYLPPAEVLRKPNHPKDVSDIGFSGCIKNLLHNGQLYDLHVGQHGEHKNAKYGCPRETAVCGPEGPLGNCGPHGSCVASLQGTYRCHCKPGWRGARCEKETSVKDFEKESFIQWDFKDSYYQDMVASLGRQYVTELQLSFRTRQRNGYLFKATNLQKSEYVILEIRDKRIQFRYNLGSGEEIVSLYNVTAADGKWHTVYVERYGRETTLKMDSGVGRYFTQHMARKGSHVLIKLHNRGFYMGADVKIPTFDGRPIVDYDYHGSCANDVRFGGAWLPMSHLESKYSSAAEFARSQNINDDCPSNECAKGLITCRPPLLCTDLWRLAECRCPLGYARVASPQVCVEINECIPNPCFKGTCRNLLNKFVCDCPPGYSGERCELRKDESTGSAFVSTGFILAIVICTLVLLLVVLIFIIYTKRKRPEKHLTLGVDPGDDVRENIINYDEEGVGEEDQNEFDINKLKKPVGSVPDYTVKKPPLEELPPKRREKPLKKAPGDQPDMASFINDRLAEADDDPSAPPYDGVREFAFEGGGSTAGSLSSLASHSDPDEHTYDYLHDWGPRFTRLADMYGAGH